MAYLKGFCSGEDQTKGSRYQTKGSRYQIKGSRYQIKGTRCQTKGQVPNKEQQITVAVVVVFICAPACRKLMSKDKRAK